MIQNLTEEQMKKLWKFYITYDERNIRSLSMSGHNGDGGLFDGKSHSFCTVCEWEIERVIGCVYGFF